MTTAGVQYDVKLSNSLFTYHRQNHPPTGVEFSVYCNFYGPHERNLVVAGSTVLKVYRLVYDGESHEENGRGETAQTGPGESNRGGTEPLAKLEHLQTFNCFGIVVGMEKIKLSPTRDSLLLLFREAKVSLVEYDPFQHELKTVAIRSLEKDEYKDGCEQMINVPLIKVDPLNRCAALLVYGKQLAIIPFVKRDSGLADLSDLPPSLGTTRPGPQPGLGQCNAHVNGQLEFYTIRLRDLDEEKGVVNIHDMAFLDGYYEPTLLLLYEPVPTWAGRVAIRQDTCAIMALSLNVYQRVHPPVWSYSNLPFNSFKVLPVPKPIGGVLIISVNALLYLNQSVPPYGVSLNCLTDASTAFPLKEQAGVRIALDACHCEFLADDRIVFSLKNGDIYILTLFTDGMRSICKFIFDLAASSVLGTCLTLCEQGYLFLGSRLGNSLLLKYTEAESVDGEEPERDPEPEPEKKEEGDENGSTAEGEQKDETSADGAGDQASADDEAGVATKEAVKAEAAEETPEASSETVQMDSENTDQKAAITASNNSTNGSNSSTDGSNKNTNGSNKNADSSTKDNGVTEPPVEEASNEDEEDSGEPAAKRQKIGSDNIDEWAASDVQLIEDSAELTVYKQGTGDDLTSGGKLFYRFEKADSLPNIGPIIRLAMGEPAFQSGLSNKTDTDVEIATISGHGRNGALSVLQRTIKPQVITTFELPGCTDLWTVRSSTAREPEADENAHQFLILSRNDSTMILQTGQEINELDHSGFCTQSPTIFAGSLADGRYVIQVCPGSVRLLEGTRQLQQVPIDVGSPLVAASLADPHVLVMSEDGLVIHLTLRGDDTHGYKLSVLKPQFPAAKSRIIAYCIYKDVSGMFVTKNQKLEEMQKPKRTTRSKASVEVPKEVEKTADFDDEDELLYGSSVDIKDLVAGGLSGAHIVPSAQNKDEANEEEYEENIRTIAPVEATYWVFLARENGALEIYSLPDYKLCYFVKNFPLANKVLSNAALLGQASSPTTDAQLPKVMEIFMCALGMHSSRPLLFARIDSDLHIYEAYPFYEKQKEGHLKIQFRRLPYAVNMEPRRVYKQKEDDPTLSLRWIRPFTDVSGYNGVFVCGRRPHWVFMTARGELRAHPMLGDGRIYSFATFHNVNCAKGFLFFNKYGELRICTLPTHLSYDSPWPIRKVPLQCTPHFVNYHVDSRTYCVVTSSEQKATTLPRLAGEDKEFEPIVREGGRFIPPTVDRFALELWSPVSWESIPNTRIEMDEWEKVMCVKNVMIASEGTTSGEKGLLAVGTIHNYGEDCTAKGRIILLDVIEVVPEPGQPLTRSKVKTILSKPQNAPVTALCSVKGHLMAAVGQKLFLFQLKDNDLVGMAFLDTQVYILTAISLKSFILIGDVYKSITLLRYQEESKTFAVVSKDMRPLQVYAVEYLIDNTQMAFLVSDNLCNMMVYMYQPENRETYGGQKLVRRGDFNIGSRVNTMVRIKSRVADIPRSERRLLSMVETRHVTVYASLDGALGFLLPIAEKTYRRLLMLQNVLNSYVAHVAGLNPRGFRVMQTESKELTNPQKNVIDGDLINNFMDLNFNEKAEVARKIGTTVHQIQLDFAEIEGLTCHF